VTDERRQIDANVRGYRRVARRYERIHGEIFNEREQARLRSAVERALGAVQSDSGGRPRVLDFGCGTGNLTGHLLELGATVVAADISPRLLEMVDRRFGSRDVETLRLNGRDLAEVPDGSLDLAVAYSVLHHIPDYLTAVRELCRVLRPGGVLMLDHESAPNEWSGDPQLEAYRDAVLRHELAKPKRLRRFADPGHIQRLAGAYWLALRRRRNPRYWPEGDIHVWPDDHIEWERVREVIDGAGLEVLAIEDYLLYRRGVPAELHEQYRPLTADVRLLLARRPTEPAG
jgi:SAM-dependent methyltransferase